MDTPQVPDEILHDVDLNEAIGAFPLNYNFEWVHAYSNPHSTRECICWNTCMHAGSDKASLDMLSLDFTVMDGHHCHCRGLADAGCTVMRVLQCGSSVRQFYIMLSSDCRSTRLCGD